MTDEELKLLVESNACTAAFEWEASPTGDGGQPELVQASVRHSKRAFAIQAMVEQRATDRLEHEERMRFLEETQRQLVQ